MEYLELICKNDEINTDELRRKLAELEEAQAQAGAKKKEITQILAEYGFGGDMPSFGTDYKDNDILIRYGIEKNQSAA